MKIKCVFSGWTTKEWKTPEPLRRKKHFFIWFKNNLPKPHERQEKRLSKDCMLCSVLGSIDQQRKDLNKIVSENIIFSNI